MENRLIRLNIKANYRRAEQDFQVLNLSLAGVTAMCKLSTFQFDSDEITQITDQWNLSQLSPLTDRVKILNKMQNMVLIKVHSRL